MPNARRNHVRVQPWERGRDHDGILPALDAVREADGADLAEQPDITEHESMSNDERDFCDGCGKLCVPEASTASGRLLCAECTKEALDPENVIRDEQEREQALISAQHALEKLQRVGQQLLTLQETIAHCVHSR